MRFKMLREQPNPDYEEGVSPLSESTIFAHVGDDDYVQADDAHYTVGDHCTDMQAEHGMCFAAELIAP